jgi:hypothetical protein
MLPVLMLGQAVPMRYMRYEEVKEPVLVGVADGRSPMVRSNENEYAVICCTGSR